jgi:hypothetical protein
MADLLEQSAQEDERGRQLAEQSTAHDQHGAKPLAPDEQAKLDQIEAGMQDGGSTGTPRNSDRGSADSGNGGGGNRLLNRENLTKAGQFLGRNKKKAGISGAIGVLLTSAIFGFLSLLPLKLESFIKNVYNHEFGRSEHYAERRVDRIVYRFIYEKTAGTIATDPLFTNGGPLSVLYKNWAQSNYLQKLETSKNIKIKAGPRGTIEVTVADETKPVSLSSESDLAQYLDKGPLKAKAARNAISAYAREETKWFQVLKRHHLRKWMRSSLRISHFGIKEQTDQQAKGTDPAAQTPTDQALALGPDEVIAATEAEGISAIVGGADNLKNDVRTPDASGLPSGVAPDPVSNTPADSAGKSAATDELKASVAEVQKASDTASKSAIRDGIDKLLQQVATDSITKAMSATATRAVPIAGWVALASDIDNFMWNGHIRNLLIFLHSAQYASVFVEFASVEDQFKAGKLSGQQVSDVMTRIADIEKSNAFQRIYLNQDTGQKIDSSKGVNNSIGNPLIQSSSPTCDATYFLKEISGNAGPAPTSVSSADFWTYTYRSFAANPTTPIHTPLCLIHPIVKFISGVAGTLIGDAIKLGTWVPIHVIDFIGGLFGNSKVSKELFNSASSAAAQGMIWTMTQVFVPAATGRETKAPLGNAIDAGGDVLAQGYTRDTLGGKAITYQQASTQMAMIDQQQRQDLGQQGLVASLFSMDSTHSFASRFTGMMPATPSDAASRAGTTAVAMIANPIKFFSSLSLSFLPASSAANLTDDPYGIQQYGYDESELDQPLALPTRDIAGPPDSTGKATGPDGKIDSYDCVDPATQKPITDPKVTDLCRLDMAAAEALTSNYTTANDGGLQ